MATADNIIRLNDVATPRLDEYFGVWAIEPQKFQAAFGRIAQMDLQLHVNQSRQPKLRTAAVMTTPRARAASSNEVPLGQANVAGSKIGLISLSGPLMKQVGSLEEGTSTVEVRMAIRQALANDEIGALMFLVDSPGGTVSGTADLAAEIAAARQQKPCMAFVEDLCASAAYWTASACGKVYANNHTCLVGSIGTYLGLYDLSGAAGQAGIKAKLYATGTLKGAGFPGAEITAEQDEYFQAMVDQTQTHFAAAVSANRKLTAEQVKAVATGAVFHASDAQAKGLIDGIKTFDEALAELSGEAQKAQQRGGKAGRTVQRSLAMKTESAAGTAMADQIQITDETEEKGDPNESTGARAAVQDECDCTCSACQDGECQNCDCGGCAACQEDGCPGCNSEKSSAATAGSFVKEAVMAETTTGASTVTPKAASLKELKTALPKSSAEFREQCLEENLTLEQAQASYIAQQDAAIDDLQAKSRKVGVDAIRTTGVTAETLTKLAGENPRQQLTQIAAGYVQSGMKRNEAFARATRENPELRQAMVVDHNLKHGRKKAVRALLEDSQD